MIIYKKIRTIVTDIFVLFCLVLLVAFIGCMLKNIKPSIVASGSMEPTIPTGSVVLIDQNKSFRDVNVGDIICYKTEETNVLHRVNAIDTEAETLTTKGDANDAVDFAPVTAAQVVGVYKTHIPKLGFWITDAKNAILGGKVYMLFPIVLLLLLPEIVELFPKKTKKA